MKMNPEERRINITPSIADRHITKLSYYHEANLSKFINFNYWVNRFVLILGNHTKAIYFTGMFPFRTR